MVGPFLVKEAGSTGFSGATFFFESKDFGTVVEDDTLVVEVCDDCDTGKDPVEDVVIEIEEDEDVDEGGGGGGGGIDDIDMDADDDVDVVP